MSAMSQQSRFAARPPGRSAAGFSLLEIIVAVAILGIITLGIAGAINGMLKAQMMISDKDEANEFAVSLGRYLYTEAACTEALANVQLPPISTPPTKVPVAIANYSGFGASAPTVNVSAGMQISQRLRIRELNLANKGTPPQAVVIQTASGPLNYQRQVAQIELLMERQDDGNWRGSAPRYYEFPVLIDPLDGGRIKRCSAEPTNLDYCNVTGGALATLPSGQQICQPAPGSQCFVKGTFATTVCDPNGYGCPAPMLNPVTGTAGCPLGASGNPIAPTQSGFMDVTLPINCGKKCSVDVRQMTTFYLCQECL